MTTPQPDSPAAMMPCPFCGGALKYFPAGEYLGKEHEGWWSHPTWPDIAMGVAAVCCPAYTWRAWTSETERLTAWNHRDTLAALPAPAPPAGWVLVPLESTDEMASAGDMAIWQKHFGGKTCKTLYRAMLAARPPSPPAADRWNEAIEAGRATGWSLGYRDGRKDAEQAIAALATPPVEREVAAALRGAIDYLEEIEPLVDAVQAKLRFSMKPIKEMLPIWRAALPDREREVTP